MQLAQVSSESNSDNSDSIAGYGMWLLFGIVVVAGLLVDQIGGKHFASCGKTVRGAIFASAGWIGLALSFALLICVTKVWRGRLLVSHRLFGGRKPQC